MTKKQADNTINGNTNQRIIQGLMIMKLSLQHKIVILIIMIAVLLAASSVLVSNSMVKGMIDENYKTKATDLARTVAVVINKETAKSVRDAVMTKYSSIDKKDRVGSEEWGSDEFNEYVSKYSAIEKDKDFKALKKEIRAIQAVNDVDCIYTISIDAANKSFIYLMDAALEDACPPGCIDPLYDMNKKILTDPTVGFPAYITNTEEYGWLVTAGEPVYDSKGTIICYAMVDISMEKVRSEQMRFLLYMVGIVLLLTVIICVLAIVYVRRSVVKPILSLSEAAASYSSGESSELYAFKELDIRTGDEIEKLADSMQQMEEDINTNISNLKAVSSELAETRFEADQMNKLAKKDPLTGIRNKLSYNEHIAEMQQELAHGNRKFGILIADLNDLKKTNDTYGHDKGDISIITLSQIICETFAHSPVFRIGGDEFAVIIRNDDYTNVDALIDEVSEKFDAIRNDPSLEPWQQISASLGYALYNPKKDEYIDSVFRRADHIMYDYKKKMKGIE